MDTTVKLLTSYGALGLVLALLVIGWLVPRSVVENLRTDRDAWKETAEQERKAHQITRDALIERSVQADAAIETAKTANALLSQLGHRGGGGS